MILYSDKNRFSDSESNAYYSREIDYNNLPNLQATRFFNNFVRYPLILLITTDRPRVAKVLNADSYIKYIEFVEETDLEPLFQFCSVLIFRSSAMSQHGDKLNKYIQKFDKYFTDLDARFELFNTPFMCDSYRVNLDTDVVTLLRANQFINNTYTIADFCNKFAEGCFAVTTACRNKLFIDLQKALNYICGYRDATLFRDAFTCSCSKGYSIGKLIRVMQVTVSDTCDMFRGCKKVQAIEVTDWRFLPKCSLRGMFSELCDLVWLKFQNCDTSNVIDMSGMFAHCVKLEQLDLTGLNTSNCINMRGMFGNCAKLSQLDLRSFDTSKVTDMSSMFKYCGVTALDVSMFNTSNVVHMHEMFCGCSNLQELNLNNFDTSKIVSMNRMFSDCSSLRHLDISNFKTSEVFTMEKTFSCMHSLRSINLGNLDTSEVTSMAGMFECCDSLKNLDLSKLDTSCVTNMSRMFERCRCLENIKLSNFDTRCVTNMFCMFTCCDSLVSLQLSNFDTRRVTNMGGMFSWCKSLVSLQLSNFDTRRVRDMSDMFYDCSNLKNLDIANFDMSCDLLRTKEMFEGCKSLERVALPEVNVPRAVIEDLKAMGTLMVR